MIASGEYRDAVWPPGPNNPLGLAAVRLEPGLLVYLHDTNQRQLFEQDMLGVKGYESTILDILTRHKVNIVSKSSISARRLVSSGWV